MSAFKKIDTINVTESGDCLSVSETLFEKLSEEAFTQNRYFFQEKHIKKWRTIYDDDLASPSEKQKMWNALQNAVLSKNGKVPTCQDCGTDSVYIFRGNNISITGNIESAVERGAIKARRKNPFRNSIFLPDHNFSERNSGNNSPTEIHYFNESNPEVIRGIFCNKGGGSGSKLWQFSMPPLLAQDREKLLNFLKTKITELGHAACPPYELSIVLGGENALDNMSLLTLSTLGEYGFLKNPRKKIQRDLDIENDIKEALSRTDIGAQGKGKFFLMPDGIRIFRAPRHAAHFFISIGVSCTAHRVSNFYIDRTGVYLEQLEENPERFLPEKSPKIPRSQKIINLSSHISTDTLHNLQNLKAGEDFILNGSILGGRDKAHFRWIEYYKKNGAFPEYLYKYLAVCYVGPSDTPDGEIIGSFGPTTASRMDEFSEALLSNSVLPLSIAKGTRSAQFISNCKSHGGMYASMQGGVAALLRRHIVDVRIIDYEDLGMEAVRLYTVKDFPLQMVVSSTGEDFYSQLGIIK